jgi:hypothetical protein
VSNPIYEMEVSFADAMELMEHAVGIAPEAEQRNLRGDGEVDCWKLPPQHLISLDGIFVDLDSINGISLTGKERQVRLACPSGAPREPCLTFPCKLRELEEFVRAESAHDWINPFAMAEWAQGRIAASPGGGQSPEPHHASGNGEELRALEALGLLAETFATKQKGKYQRAGKPSCAQIAEAMTQQSSGIYGMGKSKLQRLLSEALNAWHEKRH